MLARIYQYQVCPFCWKVKALLHLKGIAYDAVEVHPLNKREIAFSQYKKVPIYIDEEGKQINDSSEIMRHIEETHPSTPVFERSDEETHWLSWANEQYVRALPPMIYRSFSEAYKAFQYITKVSAFGFFQRHFIRISGAIAMKIVARKLARRLQIRNVEKHFLSQLTDWEAAIGSRDFLGRGKPNAADVAVFGISKVLENLPCFSLVKQHTSFYAWYQRMDKLCGAPHDHQS